MKSDKELFEAYKQDVYRLCRYTLQNKSDAEDICQEVFIKALQQNRNEVIQEKAWLMRIAINLCKNHLGRKARGIHKEIRSFLVSRTGNFNRIEEEVEQKELSNDMRKMFGKLSLKIRVVMILRYVNEQSLEEISKTLDIPLGTVKSRVSKGLSLMRKIMDLEGKYNLKGEECLD
jgi:RNA polymerase sigma factor (sigma-70 family)